jgi:hypothetical protein
MRTAQSGLLFWSFQLAGLSTTEQADKLCEKGKLIMNKPFK